MSLPERNYLVYDPHNGVSFWPTLEQARAEARELLSSYRDSSITDGWPEETGELVVLRVVARATQIHRIDKPDDLDEEGYSPSLDEYWNPDFAYVCEYEMQPVSE